MTAFEAPKLEALKKALVERGGSGARFGLERMGGALDALGHPERALACVHVAGTNGKGSVCAMVEAMARAGGSSTATFTSPHLCRLAERIRIDGEPIGDEAFAAALEAVLDDRVPWLTFFETITAAFFVAAERRGVDLAVVEVGLGGRLDATNLIPPPRAAAVVSVSRDHTAILGDDLAGIAREKAAIAKSGTPLVLGPLGDEALEACLEVAERAGAGAISAVALDDRRAVALGRRGLEVVRVEARGEVVVVEGRHTIEARPALEGAHQRGNLGVAAALGWELGSSEAAIVRGLETASWPGRFERLQRGGVEVLLDCAHNEDGAAALAAGLAGRPMERTLLVFGAMADKPWGKMLDRLASLARVRIYAPALEELAGRRPASPGDLAARHSGERCAHPEGAIDRALELAATGDTIVVAGSIFLVGAVRAHLLGLERDVLLPM